MDTAVTETNEYCSKLTNICGEKYLFAGVSKASRLPTILPVSVAQLSTYELIFFPVNFFLNWSWDFYNYIFSVSTQSTSLVIGPANVTDGC